MRWKPDLGPLGLIVHGPAWLARAVALGAVVVAACSGSDIRLDPVRPARPTASTPTEGVDSADASSVPPVADNGIRINTDVVLAGFDPFVLGTNVPAWLLDELLGDEEFRRVAVASGTTLLRMPGGSWSNYYDWLACESRDPVGCRWPWAARPSDFLEFLEATGLPGLWTVRINGTAQEAAALVAFFNGDVGDQSVIGPDRTGRDWHTVGHWARLRAEGGNPDPVRIDLWEVGNEVFGAVESAGPQCARYGWEEVWTCDGTEYVEGTDEHDGFLQFREAMLAVDSDIRVGAVGVGEQRSWGNWGENVMAAAGNAIDFYVVHHYASDGALPASEVLDIPRRSWPVYARDIRAGYERYSIDVNTPIAVTEHNMVSFIDADDERLMITALNGFYLADTIGQFAVNGITIANQWNIVNGRAENGSDYGLIDGETMERSPAYYSMVLWSRFGDEVVEVELGDDPDLTELLVYGGRGDGSAQLLVINPTGGPIEVAIELDPTIGDVAVTADAVVAESSLATTVRFNGSEDPSVDLTDPPAAALVAEAGRLAHEFPAYSITLLRWDTDAA